MHVICLWARCHGHHCSTDVGRVKVEIESALPPRPPSTHSHQETTSQQSSDQFKFLLDLILLNKLVHGKQKKVPIQTRADS